MTFRWMQSAAQSVVLAPLMLPVLSQATDTADITSTDTFSWKEWINVVVDMRFAQSQERIARLEEKITASATALGVSEQMLQLRLAHLNELTEEMRGRDLLYAKESALEDLKLRVERLAMTTASGTEVGSLSARISSIENWRASLEGDMAGKRRGSEPMMTVLWISVAAVLAVVVPMVIARVRENRKNGDHK